MDQMKKKNHNFDVVPLLTLLQKVFIWKFSHWSQWVESVYCHSLMSHVWFNLKSHDPHIPKNPEQKHPHSSKLTPQISLMNLQNQDAKYPIQLNQRTHFNCFQRHKVINLSSKSNKCLKKNVLTEFFFFSPCDPSDLGALLRGLDPQYGNHSTYPKCLIHLKARLTQYSHASCLKHSTYFEMFGHISVSEAACDCYISSCICIIILCMSCLLRHLPYITNACHNLQYALACETHSLCVC